MIIQQRQQRRALVWSILLLLVLGTGPTPEFTNWSGTLRGLPVERYFTPTNGNLPADAQSADVQLLDFSSGLQALREILGNATANGKRVKAHGSKWSFSQVAYTDEYLVDSTGLNYVKIQFVDQPSWFAAAYQTELTRLAFVQAGVKMKHLQRALFDNGLTLSATGESDGQRLVGAVSTGAHGSAVEYGAIAEMVRAIHIVLPEEEVVLQRASNPVVTALFATDWLGATRLISDDALFNTALVSYGSFGIIHGLLIQAEDLFTIQVHSKVMKYSDAIGSVQSLNMARLGFDDYEATEIPREVMFTINPYRLDDIKAVHVRTIRKLPWIAAVDVKPVPPAQNFLFALVLPTMCVYMARFLFFGLFDLERKCLGWLVQNQIEERFVEHEPYRTYTLNQFTSANAEADSGPTLARKMDAEIAVSVDDLPSMLNTVLDVMHKMKHPGVITLRYVAPTQATLGFTAFAPRTVAVGLTSTAGEIFFSDGVKKLDVLFDDVQASSLAHRWHLAKFHQETPEFLKRSFGAAAIEAWKTERSLLLSSAAQEMFSSDWTDLVGLT
jgi:hypothetical protein